MTCIIGKKVSIWSFTGAKMTQQALPKTHHGASGNVMYIQISQWLVRLSECGSDNTAAAELETQYLTTGFTYHYEASLNIA